MFGFYMFGFVTDCW